MSLMPRIRLALATFAIAGGTIAATAATSAPAEAHVRVLVRTGYVHRYHAPFLLRPRLFVPLVIIR